jgi:hypothetical protein
MRVLLFYREVPPYFECLLPDSGYGEESRFDADPVLEHTGEAGLYRGATTSLLVVLRRMEDGNFELVRNW